MNFLDQIKKNWLVMFLLTILIILGAGVRFSLLEKHFSHIDDIGVAVTILDRQEYMYSIEERFDDWRNDVLSGEMGSSAESIARRLDEMSLLGVVTYSALWWKNILHAIPNGWTYAPGQFYLTNLFIDSDQNYNESKFWGRLPSLIFNLTSIALLMLFYFHLSDRESLLKYVVVGVSVLSLSWQNIIYSAQMENYAASTFAMLFIFSHLVYITKNPIISNKKSFFRGVLLAIPGLFQYQALFFIPALYIAILFYLKSQNNFKEIFKNTIFAFLGFFTIFIFFIYTYLKDSVGRGITWNAGPKNEFVLNLHWNDGFFSVVSETVKFFIFNFQVVVEAMLSPVSQYSYENPVLGWFLFIFSLIGIYSMFKSKNNLKKILGIFIIGSIITWVLLIFLKIFPLSPTRHSMVLGAIFLILFVEGFLSVEKFINPVIGFKSVGGLTLLPIFFSVIWLSLFLFTLNQGMDDRIDPFNESKILQNLKQDEIDLTVVFDSTLQLRLMSKITDNFPSIDANAWTEGGKVEISNYGADDKHLNGKKSLKFAIISSWSCFKLNDNRSKELIKGVIIENYNLNAKYEDIRIINQDCSNSKVEIEWSPLTTNGQNNFNYTVLEIRK